MAINAREENIIIRLTSIIEDIPLPITGGGTQSADVNGFVNFGFDFAEIKQPLLNAFWHLRVREYEEAEQIATDIEGFIKVRREERWGAPQRDGVTARTTLRDVTYRAKNNKENQ
jgi:hypothetical protein